MPASLSRVCLSSLLAMFCVWIIVRELPLRAQGTSGGGAPTARIRLLCDLARNVEWPETNKVLAIALIKYTPQEADQVRSILSKVDQATWEELWVTNFTTTPKESHLTALPSQGILAMNGAQFDANRARMALNAVSSRRFLTVGDGYGNFDRIGGMVNLSGNLLTYSRALLEERGFAVPQVLFSSYEKGNLQVLPR